MEKNATQEYILGITEGRSLLKSTPHSIADMQRHVDNIGTLLSRRSSKEMGDTYRGERDFWKSQIKKAMSPQIRKKAA